MVLSRMMTGLAIAAGWADTMISVKNTFVELEPLSGTPMMRRSVTDPSFAAESMLRGTMLDQDSASKREEHGDRKGEEKGDEEHEEHEEHGGHEQREEQEQHERHEGHEENGEQEEHNEQDESPGVYDHEEYEDHEENDELEEEDEKEEEKEYESEDEDKVKDEVKDAVNDEEDKKEEGEEGEETAGKEEEKDVDEEKKRRRQQQQGQSEQEQHEQQREHEYEQYQDETCQKGLDIVPSYGDSPMSRYFEGSPHVVPKPSSYNKFGMEAPATYSDLQAGKNTSALPSSLGALVLQPPMMVLVPMPCPWQPVVAPAPCPWQVASIQTASAMMLGENGWPAQMKYDPAHRHAPRSSASTNGAGRTYAEGPKALFVDLSKLQPACDPAKDSRLS